MFRGLLPPSFAYIRIIIYKFLHIASIFYTSYTNMNDVSHKFHPFLHLMLIYAIQGILNQYRVVYFTLLHNQILGVKYHDNIVSQQHDITL